MHIHNYEFKPSLMHSKIEKSNKFQFMNQPTSTCCNCLTNISCFALLSKRVCEKNVSKHMMVRNYTLYINVAILYLIKSIRHCASFLCKVVAWCNDYCPISQHNTLGVVWVNGQYQIYTQFVSKVHPTLSKMATLMEVYLHAF